MANESHQSDRERPRRVACRLLLGFTGSAKRKTAAIVKELALQTLPGSEADDATG